MTLLENELIRLRQETTKGQYDLQAMLYEQVNNKSQMFIDIPHYHAKYRRNDSFKIRPCHVTDFVFSLKVKKIVYYIL